MSLFGKLKLIDLYKKVPHDLTEGTYGGAIRNLMHKIYSVHFLHHHYGSAIYQLDKRVLEQHNNKPNAN